MWYLIIIIINERKKGKKYNNDEDDKTVEIFFYIFYVISTQIKIKRFTYKKQHKYSMIQQHYNIVDIHNDLANVYL